MAASASGDLVEERERERSNKKSNKSEEWEVKKTKNKQNSQDEISSVCVHYCIVFSAGHICILGNEA